MKKKRFGLLAKIILFTGLLTILTVSSSLVVGTLVLNKNSQDIFVKNCEDISDYIESVFFPDENNDTSVAILNLLVEDYEKVRNDYDKKNEQEINDYQAEMVVTLFEPEPGMMGMDYDKATRNNFYSNSASSVLSLCKKFHMPFSSVVLFDKEKQRLIKVFDSTLSVNGNKAIIGLVGEEPLDWELDFYNESSHSYNYRSVISKDIVKSYNYVEITLANSNYKCFVKSYYSLKETNNTFKRQLITELIVTVAAAALLVFIYAVFTKLYLIKNVERLTKSTNKFVGMMKNDEPLEVTDPNVKSTDEIRELSDAFTMMQGQIITYVDNIKQARDIEQAFKTEVNIASKIQLESLPAETHFDRNIELRAFIKPAKGVGGDFYDYFYIDKDHLAVVAADVSGKGIPASLFMMRAKESIRGALMNEKDLSTALFKINNSLCVNNKEGFFVTVFLGVLDLKTYKFDFISAGHEKPFIKHNNECKRLEVESNFVLGLEEDFAYEQQSIKLEEGDFIILYTDGLNEAINSNKEEFGYERIKESLSKNESLKLSIDTVLKDLEEFEGEEEQFDDITILAFNIKKNVVTYSYSNPSYGDIPDVTAKVEEYLSDMDPVTLSKIGVVIDEVMNNIISYGRTKTNKKLSVSIEKRKDGAALIFVDNSHPFNPLLKEKRTIQENMDQGIVGGVGISIVKSITKETEYTYSNNKNILVIIF